MFRVYKYFLAQPLDWIFCFMTVEEYKASLRKKYGENKKANDRIFGTVTGFIEEIDDLVDFALDDFDQMFGEYTRLRVAPLVFPLPTGEMDGSASFAVILKRAEDGDTFIYSSVKLAYLE
ncbi:hypothetical protein IW492_10890 [Enterococcus sp. BWB1-3]|uniref:hypothetical protein n=1 Tax=unclassified Enterococcus TaxID=2608891 RepID=UPI001923D075|nr:MULTISPECIES: hypothetical protein [unclassified Enterococcus]MBL1229737.1 hypothetical protein [Enterococcus sp. BWB1-3]MCB5952876.1 hypothetical protein [Enterococcus sp. BWT-B8]MCB5953885.1 hypothetical protein [Enterococcus sp. CWB-B31]